MKEYEVIVDLGSRTFRVEAESSAEAEEKALNLFENLPLNEKIEEWWVGDISEVEE